MCFVLVGLWGPNCCYGKSQNDERKGRCVLRRRGMTGNCLIGREMPGQDRPPTLKSVARSASFIATRPNDDDDIDGPEIFR